MSDLSLPSLTLVPIEDEPRHGASPKSVQEPFAWPTPPLAAYPLPMCQIEPEPCEVLGRTGNVLTGLMVNFDPQQGVVRVRVPSERAPVPMRLAQIRRLTLKRPLPPLTAAPLADPGVQALLEHRPSQPYTLNLAGGETCQGRTVGHVETSHGLYLFEPLDDAGTLQRCFVPRSAYESQQIGEPLGAVLVQQRSATAAQIDQAVQTQQRLRGKRIGEMLIARQVVSPEQLLAALDKQARMPIMRLGEALVAQGCMTVAQLTEVLQQQNQERSVPLGQLLVGQALITPAQLQLALARKMGFPVVDVAQFPIDPAVLHSVPCALARRLRVLPLMRRGGRLVVAMQDTTRRDLIDEVQAVAETQIAPALALEEALSAAIEAAYARIALPRHEPGHTMPAALDPGPAQSAAAELDEAVSHLQLTLRPVGVVPAFAKVADPPAAPAAPPPAAAAATASPATRPAPLSVPAEPPRSSRSQPAARVAPASPAEPRAPQPPAAQTERGAVAERPRSDPNDAALITLVEDALARGASDIHIEARVGAEPWRVRMRRDERLEAHQELPTQSGHALLSHVKSLAGLDATETRRPQQGRLAFGQLASQHPVDLRVLTIPTQDGREDLVLHLPARLRVLPLDELGFSAPDLERLVRLLDRPAGLFLNVGPARSGRTTTMHALLAHLTLPERRIWTAEERIDLLQPELRQVEINPALGWGYTQALQAFRQADADIIMLDDLREPGAAREAVELAQSGRLVIAGLPGRSATEALARLIESSGVSPHDLADALCGVHAQLLLRRICSHCRMSRAAKDSEVQEWLDVALPRVPGEVPPPSVVEAQQRDWVERYGRDGRLRRYHSPGCPRCNHSGYRSRSAVHELLLPSADLRRLIRASAPAWHLQRQAVRDGLRSLHQDALEKMLAGITTHDEVRSVARD